MLPEIYSHFHLDEKIFIDKALEWIVNVERNHEMKLTDFLDPRQQFILNTLINRYPNIQIVFNGGYVEAERKRGLISHDYRSLDEENHSIKVLSISSEDTKLSCLDHGDYMGSILGLGLKREKIGDIIIHSNGCHCLAASETIQHLDLQLNQVHRVHVITEVLPLDQLITAKAKIEEIHFSVASMRLDGILSDATRMSRNKILSPIKSRKCKVNWKIEMNPSTHLKEGDMISLLGFGRFKLIEVSGTTKKGRILIKIAKFV